MCFGYSYCEDFKRTLSRIKEKATMCYDGDLLKELEHLQKIFEDAVKYHDEKMASNKQMTDALKRIILTS